MNLARLCFFVVFELLTTAVLSGLAGLGLDAVWGKQSLTEAAPTFAYITLIVIAAGFCPVALGGALDLSAGKRAGPWLRLAAALAAWGATVAVIVAYSGGYAGTLHLVLLGMVLVFGLAGWFAYGRRWLR